MDFTQTDANTNLIDTMMGPHSINTFDTIGVTSTIAPGAVLTSNGSWGTTPTLTVSQSGTIQLEGENADIKVNGESLMETLRGIQDRLNMLQPNPELEAESVSYTHLTLPTKRIV